MARHRLACFWTLFLLGTPLFGAQDKSPSREKEEWTGSGVFNEFATEYSHVGGATTTLGNGQTGTVAENDVAFSDFIGKRFFRALLLKTGVEWEGILFDAPETGFVPQHLYDLNMLASADFRWSRQDMVRLQIRPGFYGDFGDASYGDDVNCPLAIAYNRVVSRDFQWFLALSVNPWRRDRYLPAGGFRWQINDRWKLKMLFPQPHIEYKARDDLHLFVGGDFKGDSFRTAHNFGTLRGNPALDNTLVDYEEIRVGAGASWNVRPFVELNMDAGYMVTRQFDFHEAGVTLNSDPAPYAEINVNILFESPELLLAPRTESGSFEIPGVKFPDINGLTPK